MCLLKFQFHLINPEGQLDLFVCDILINKHRFMKIPCLYGKIISKWIYYFYNEVIVL
jgi:hypothetical protein